ncbi:MAG: hypothetical protein ACRENE_31960, partial [Polyangiaceae bacterium]
MAAGLCVLAVLAWRRLPVVLARAVMAPSWATFVGGTAAVSAGMSWWAVHGVLRDTPLSIDAA